MNVTLHLLGGSGRIGRALVDLLIAKPLASVKAIHIYCDSTKAKDLNTHYSSLTSIKVRASGYSELNLLAQSKSPNSESLAAHKHIILNLRGINNKQQWLNQPVESLELHIRSCRALVEADLWMQQGTQIFHFSSLLCDLIEGPSSLDDICEDQESYRRPYMVSRLHQEMLLAANAYQHSIATTFLRMPAVYGFKDDHRSPWVLNSLCRAKLIGGKAEPRHTDRIVYLSHKNMLLTWIISLIEDSSNHESDRTVNYLRPPMLRMSVLSLSTLVEESPRLLTTEQAQQLRITIEGDGDMSDDYFALHLNSLTSTISELLTSS